MRSWRSVFAIMVPHVSRRHTADEEQIQAIKLEYILKMIGQETQSEVANSVAADSRNDSCVVSMTRLKKRARLQHLFSILGSLFLLLSLGVVFPVSFFSLTIRDCQQYTFFLMSASIHHLGVIEPKNSGSLRDASPTHARQNLSGTGCLLRSWHVHLALATSSCCHFVLSGKHSSNFLGNGRITVCFQHACHISLHVRYVTTHLKFSSSSSCGSPFFLVLPSGWFP